MIGSSCCCVEVFVQIQGQRLDGDRKDRDRTETSVSANLSKKSLEAWTNQGYWTATGDGRETAFEFVSRSRGIRIDDGSERFFP